MQQESKTIDKGITVASVICCAVFIIATIMSPDKVKTVFNALFKFFTGNFGWAYLICVAGFVLFCVTIAFTKYGKIRLGKDDESPEFSLPAWFSMLFAAGMGIGLVFWGVAEPIYHFAGPPFAEPKTTQAASDAMRTVIFHWGFHPWASYAVVALLLAYSQFRKGNPALLSWTLEPLIGKKRVQGGLGKSIDTLAVVVTLFGVATSLGLGAMQVSTGLSRLFHIPGTTSVTIIIIAVVTLCYIVSAVTGIDKGIKTLSNINMVLAFGLMLLMLVLGPTKYILQTLIESLGNYFQNIVWLSFFMDASGTVEKHAGYDWVGAWTVFYWAWWLTWAPFVGAFIARISRGRTIREFIFGCMGAPTLLCAIWFSIMGGSAIHAEMAGGAGIADATFKDVTTAIFVLFDHYPVGGLLSIMAMVIVLIFFVTSADSATFVVGMMTSGGNMNPKNSLKIFWGLVCSSIAAMLLLAGGLKAVQTVSFVVSFPFMILMVVMIAGFLKSLESESISKTVKPVHGAEGFSAEPASTLRGQ